MYKSENKHYKELKISHIEKSYNRKIVLKNISLNVKQGEIVGLLGPNGAGKTTCFYVIVGMIQPDKGQVHIDDSDITYMPMFQRSKIGISYLPQESSIFRGLTVEENIKLALEFTEPNDEEQKKRLEELLGDFSITHIRYTQAMALSGGERRRVELARTMACHPSFIMLDEPLAGIDPIAITDIRKLIQDLKYKGVGILITDHNVRDMLDIVDRAYIINDGVVLMDGTPKQILHNKEVRRVYLGEDFRHRFHDEAAGS